MGARPSWDYVAQMLAENRWTLQEACRQMACGPEFLMAQLEVAVGQGSQYAAQALTAIGGAATAGAAITVPVWVGVLVVTVAVGGAIYMASEWGEPSSDPIERSGAVQAVIEEREALPEGEAQEPIVAIGEDREAGAASYYLVLVGNVAPKIYSVRSQTSVDSGNLRTCDFLNGGLCAGSIVDTPNGPVEAGADVPAQFEETTPFIAEDDNVARTAAWTELCNRLADIRVAPLAAGYIGFRGDVAYTIDGANGVSPNPHPCGFL